MNEVQRLHTLNMSLISLIRQTESSIDHLRTMYAQRVIDDEPMFYNPLEGLRQARESLENERFEVERAIEDRVRERETGGV